MAGEVMLRSKEIPQVFVDEIPECDFRAWCAFWIGMGWSVVGFIPGGEIFFGRHIVGDSIIGLDGTDWSLESPNRPDDEYPTRWEAVDWAQIDRAARHGFAALGMIPDVKVNPYHPKEKK